MTLPTQAYFVWDWGDGIRENNQTLPFNQSTPPFLLTLSHTYASLGNYIITVTINNMASRVTLTTSVSLKFIIEKII